MKNLIFTIAFIFLFTLGGFAQEDRISKHYIGYNIGAFSGVGLTYRFIPKRIGIQSSAFFITNRKGHQYYNHSLCFIYRIKEWQESDVLLFLGGQGLKSWIQRPSGMNVQNVNHDIYFDYSIGSGIGINLLKNKKINLNILMGYVFLDLESKDTKHNLPTLELGVFYKI